jgi:hypothetical protein
VALSGETIDLNSFGVKSPKFLPVDPENPTPKSLYFSGEKGYVESEPELPPG